MKKVKYLSFILFIFSICLFTLYNNKNIKVTKALQQNEYIVRETISYFEMENSFDANLQEIGEEEYAKKLSAHKEYLKEVSKAHRLVMEEKNVEENSRAIVIPPALDVPNITLIGVTNGGITTNNVTVNVDYCTDVGVTNKGMQIDYQGTGYTNYNSGVVCSKVGHYSVRAWNPVGYTYKSFEIVGVTNNNSNIEYFDTRGYVEITTKIAYRTIDDCAKITIVANWDSLPGNVYRGGHKMYFTVRNNNWHYDNSRPATLTYSTQKMVERHEAFTGDIISTELVNSSGEEDLKETNNILCQTITDSTNSTLSLLYISCDAPIPLDGGISSNVLPWDYTTYLTANYEFNAFVELTAVNNDFNIGNYSGFPTSSDNRMYLDYCGGCSIQFSLDYILDALEIAGVVATFLGLIPGTVVISLIAIATVMIPSIILESMNGQVLENTLIIMQNMHYVFIE